ncbi:oligosaccharide flippase family protein [Mucilaginibacter sp. BJC16-A38]|uniref:oligosaccharide flippase family protein n=1 Tax=Mucilaginibacter phenanthrenivorans TaxID=1234842 RepID=UPI0021570F44|nr:oligosaccharide flippase family protein [Mucilaginibacter phenanthrenivorans]MCR8556141.1 oligosaccharide flippase family protein [Mucilaginibacter phenanthrenivorans]
MSIAKKLINKHTLSLASNAVMPVVGMVTVGLLARSMSVEAFGDWSFFLITFTLANLTRSGFLQTSLVKFYAGATKEQADMVAGSTWFLGFVITATLGFFSLIALIFYHGHQTTEITIKWFAIIYFSTLPSSVALWILQAEERFDKIFILQLIWQGTFLLLIIVLMILHEGSFQVIIYAYFTAVVITSLYSITTGWARISSISSRKWECIRELANFGKYSVGTSISSYLLRSSDNFIIKFMFADPAFIGIYYLPQRLMEIIEVPLRSFIATAMPAMSAAVNRDDKNYITYILKKYSGILTILIIPVSLASILFADIIIDVLGGHKYLHTNASNIFRIFMCFAVLLPVDRFFGITLDILNKPKINMIKVIIMLVVNVIGDFVGIYFFHSLYAVALASIFTFLAGVIYGYWVLRKYLNFTMFGIITMGFIETKALIAELILKYKNRNTK